MSCPRSTISRSLSRGTWTTSPGVANDPGEVEPLPGEEAELAQEAVLPMDGDDAVLVAQPLNDRHRSRLDDEEVAALVAGGKQDLAGLDLANAPKPPQSRPLVFVEARECPVAIDGLRQARSDWLVLGRSTVRLLDLRRHDLRELAPMPFKPLPVYEERRGAVDSRLVFLRRRLRGRARGRCARGAPSPPHPHPARAVSPPRADRHA